MSFPLEPHSAAHLFPVDWPPELGLGIGLLAAGALAYGVFSHYRYRRLTEQRGRDLRSAEQRFGQLFDEAPVAIVEEDFRELARRLEALRDHGVRDLREHLAANPSLSGELFQCVRINAANRRALALADVNDLETYRARVSRNGMKAPPTAFIEELVALWEGRDTVALENAFRTADGRQHRGIVQWTLVRENGVRNLARVQVAFTDLTALHASEERYRQLFEGAVEGVYEVLPSGEVRNANPALARMLGFDSPAELLALGAAEIERFYLAPEQRRRFLAAAAAGDYLRDFESEIRRRDGSARWFSESVRAVRDRAGQLLYFHGFVTDITSRKQAELALRESETRWRLAVQSSAAGLWENNLATGEAFYSDRSKEILGFAPHELSHRREDWTSRIHPDDLPKGKQAMKDHLAGLKPYYQVEHRFRAKDGTYKWIQSRAQAQLDEQGRAVRIVGTHVDVTERMQAEQELRASESRYRTLFEHSPIAIVELDDRPVVAWLESLRAQGVTDLLRYFREHPEEFAGGVRDLRIIGMNAAALRLAGGNSIEEVTAGIARIFTPDAIAFRMEAFGALWSGRNTVEREVTMGSLDGTPRRVHTHWWIPLMDGEPQYAHTQIAFVDLTQMKSAELALSAERERLGVTLRAMAEGVVTVDNEGVVRFINDSACAITGRSAEAAVGRPVAEVCGLRHEKTQAAVLAPDEAARRGGKVVELPPHTALVRPDGEQRLVGGRCAPMHDLGGRTIGAVLVLHDATERTRLEAELQRASKLESVGILAGGIAHDFNNILAIIMGNLTLAMLDESIRNHPASRWLQAAEQGATRARDLTQQLLTFAKGGEPVRASVMLPELLREAAEFALHGSSVRCDFAIEANPWPAEVDKGQIGQVVQNLVLNAVQAMPNGGFIRITLKNEALAVAQPGLQAGNYLRLSIADRGEGIRPEHMSRIFEPYFTTKQQGIGLGLATVYSILKKHQGHITVESKLGEGTAFHLWLPASAAPVPARVQSQSPFDLLRGRVLFMDDEEPIRQMASVLLSRLGLEAVTAEDGDEAVRLFQEARAAGRPFDVVVMDLTVPGGKGGLQAMQEMQAIDPGVRAIVSSGYSSNPVMANFRAHGFRGMVAKPYRITDLAQALRQVLES